MVSGLKVNKYVFWIFFFGIFCPTIMSASLGSLRLTLYRAVLIFFILTAFGSILKLCRPSFKNPHFLLLMYTLWAAVALAVNHGVVDKLETSGVYFIEVIGPYMIAIAFCTNIARLKQLINAYILAVSLTLLITLPEALTGINWLQKVLGTQYGGDIGTRMGLHRSYGTFDHPILQGVFASTAVGLTWFTMRYKLFVGAIVATITSVSSGALVSIFIQFMIIGWEKFSRNINNRWVMLFLLLAGSYIAIDLVSNRSAMRAILTNLTMSPHTAYWRMIIWEYGMQNVFSNPIFGIGFHDWVRPYWMYSGSMDAFWLVSMVRYGFPAFLLYAGAFIAIIVGLFKFKTKDAELNSLRRGWLTGMIGLAVSSCTVHLWNNSFIFINFYLGIGSAMLFLFAKEAAKKRRERLEAS